MLLNAWGNSWADFTADGSHALAMQSNAKVLWSLATGAASASQVATGIYNFVALRGTEVLAVTGSGSGLIVDVSGKLAPWSLATGAPTLVPSPDGAAIVYATNFAPAGLYAVAVP